MRHLLRVQHAAQLLYERLLRLQIKVFPELFTVRGFVPCAGKALPAGCKFMKNHSFRIALSAVACALAVVMLTLGMYVPFMTITAYVFAGLAIMRRSPKIFGSAPFCAISPPAFWRFCSAAWGISGDCSRSSSFFGLHPIVNSLQIKFKINKWIALVVKTIWFDVSVWLVWKFAGLFVVQYDWINDYIILIIATAGSALFVFYDFVMFRCQRLVNYYVRQDRAAVNACIIVERRNMLDKNMEFTGFVEALGSNGEGIVKERRHDLFRALYADGRKSETESPQSQK